MKVIIQKRKRKFEGCLRIEFTKISDWMECEEEMNKTKTAKMNASFLSRLTV